MALRPAHPKLVAIAPTLLACAAVAIGCGGDDEGDEPAATTSPEREKAIEKFQDELDELSEQQRKQLEGE